MNYRHAKPVVTIEREGDSHKSARAFSDYCSKFYDLEWVRANKEAFYNNDVFTVSVDVMDVPVTPGEPLLVGFDDGVHPVFPEEWLDKDGRLPLVSDISSTLYAGFDAAYERAWTEVLKNLKALR